MQILLNFLFYYYVAVNILAFVQFAVDKQRARGKKWRISERTLLLLSAIGGCFGGYLAMYMFRHKTTVKKFKLLMPIFCIWHILLIALLYYNITTQGGAI